MRLIAFWLSAVALLVSQQQARAWGALGHEVAGRIASDYLDATARARVVGLLGDESLTDASTWADRMRSDPTPFWQNEAGPYHYVTVPPGRRYEEIGPPPEGDAVTALAMFRRELCSAATPRRRQRLALRFALHIVQDLHQPLHAGNGSDRGGNAVQIDTEQGVESFHWVWDGIVPESEGRDRAVFLRGIRRRGFLRDPAPGNGDPLHWIAESVSLRERLYPPPSRIADDYLERWFPTAQRRIAEGGLRSAAWINATFRACATRLRPGTAR